MNEVHTLISSRLADLRVAVPFRPPEQKHISVNKPRLIKGERRSEKKFTKASYTNSAGEIQHASAICEIDVGAFTFDDDAVQQAT